MTLETRNVRGKLELGFMDGWGWHKVSRFEAWKELQAKSDKSKKPFKVKL